MAGTAFNTNNWSGYVALTITNPASDLTDFSLIVPFDILPAGFGSAVQSDGGDIRVTKADDTELPIDIIEWDYNAGSPVGIMRVKYTGTLASSGTQQIKVWAGYTGGTAVTYDATETYGQYNAYPSTMLAYWPSGGGNDRTSNALHLTGYNGVVAGDSVGIVGKATSYNGANQSSYVNYGVNAEPFTFISNFKASSLVDGHIIGISDFDQLNVYSQIGVRASRTLRAVKRSGPTYSYIDTTDLYKSGVWYLGTMAVYDNTYSKVALNNGNFVIKTNNDLLLTSHDVICIGALARVSNYSQTDRFNGLICNSQIHTANLSADFKNLEYSQISSPATFWTVGTWETTGGGGGNVPTPYYYRLRAYDV